MDRLGLEDWSIAKALLTWNGQNNMESVEYETERNDAMPNCIATGWCSLLCSFYHKITSDLRVWEKKKNNDNNNDNQCAL